MEGVAGLLEVSMSGSLSPVSDVVMSWIEDLLLSLAVPLLKSKKCCWSWWSCCATIVAAGDGIADWLDRHCWLEELCLEEGTFP